MTDREAIVQNLNNQYFIKVMRAFDNIDPSSEALAISGKSLKEIYRYFEPCFFSGDFFLCKNLNDENCLDEGSYSLLYDKNILLNRTSGTIVIQVFKDDKMYFSENQNIENLLSKQNDTLIYHYKDNKEYFYANGEKIDITIYNTGSRFATQFNDLVVALSNYTVKKIRHSSCRHFSQSWSSTESNRLFFKGGGRGNNIPEKFMQESLYEFLDSNLSRGISMESSREFNIVGDYSKPKPVDIKITWREANRIALIEVKFMGAVKKESDGKIYHLSDARANRGIIQLKGYHDSVKSDLPTTIIKSFLVVIDGRRNNLSATQKTINTTDGMYFKDIEIVIDDDKKFHESIQGFEKPIRMFVEPICS